MNESTFVDDDRGFTGDAAAELCVKDLETALDDSIEPYPTSGKRKLAGSTIEFTFSKSGTVHEHPTTLGYDILIQSGIGHSPSVPVTCALTGTGWRCTKWVHK